MARSEDFDTDVYSYTDFVDFVQTIQVKAVAKTNITGTVTYMVCNDRECKPPSAVKFELQLNDK